MTRYIARPQTGTDRASDWRDRAACAGMVGFTESSEAEQKAVCRRCPVTDQCLDFAVRTETGDKNEADYWPVYGGLSRRERLALIRAAKRARTAASALRAQAGRIQETQPIGADVGVTSSYVARLCGVAPETVIRWANKGLLPYVQAGGGYRRYRLTDVNRAIREGRILVKAAP